MLAVTLFLGFPIDPSFNEALKAANPDLLALFIQSSSSSSYLCETSYQGKSYLGKFTGEINDLNNLFLLESNIFSLLKKVVPLYPYSPDSLLLFPLPVSEISSG
jgi:hypothetical protein